MENLNTNGLGICFRCRYLNYDKDFAPIFSDEYNKIECLYITKHIGEIRNSLISCKYYKEKKIKKKNVFLKKLFKPLISWLYDQLIVRK